jgi:hypothetical protein
MSQRQVPRLKILLVNLAVSAALIYRWLHGAPSNLLILWGLVMFPLVNVLLYFTAKKASSNKDHARQ